MVGVPGTSGPTEGGWPWSGWSGRLRVRLEQEATVSRFPHDVVDLHLAPVLLALDARLSELSLLDPDELALRVGVDSERPDWSEDMRRSGLLATVQHFIDLQGWDVAWHPRGLLVTHGRHRIVLGIPISFTHYFQAAPSGDAPVTTGSVDRRPGCA